MTTNMRNQSHKMNAVDHSCLKSNLWGVTLYLRYLPMDHIKIYIYIYSPTETEHCF